MRELRPLSPGGGKATEFFTLVSYGGSYFLCCVINAIINIDCGWKQAPTPPVRLLAACLSYRQAEQAYLACLK